MLIGAPAWPNASCDDGTSRVTPQRACFARRVEIVTPVAALERQWLLQWVLAWAGLSAVWRAEDGDDARSKLEVAPRAAAALGIVE